MTITLRLFLVRKRKERGRKDEPALRSLEEELRQAAESLGLPLEQKTKGMKLRDKKVHRHDSNKAFICSNSHIVPQAYWYLYCNTSDGEVILIYNKIVGFQVCQPNVYVQ